MFDVLLRRRRSVEGDEHAIATGEPITVSCFVRASSGQYPRRFRQGMLTLAGGEASWRPYWSITRPSLALDEPVTSVTTRPRDSASDWNIKSGGLYRPGGPLQSSGFTVVALSTVSGTIELAVPAADEALVAGFFRRTG